MSDATPEPPVGTMLVGEGAEHLGGNIVGGDERTYVPEVWSLLKERLSVRTMFDVGCGTGEAMRWWRDAGCGAYGLDGIPYNIKQASEYGGCILADLTTRGVRLKGIDLVWCSEVVEHIDRPHLLNLLATICCGKYLAMTFATPGQGGHHHVNEQPEAYWVDVLRAYGMVPMASLARESRALVGPEKFWHHTGLIFRRGDVEPTG